MNKLLAVLVICITSFINVQSLKAQDGPPKAMPGLQINRSELLKIFKEVNIDSLFFESKDVNGSTCYYNSDQTYTKVVIIGEETNLRLAKITYKFSTDTAVNRKSINKMAAFAYIFGKNAGMEWFATRFGEIRIGVPYTSLKSFDFNRQMKFEYLIDKKSVSLTVIPW